MHHPMLDAISRNYTSAPELHITPTLIPKVTLDFAGRRRKHHRNLTKPRGRQCSRHGLLPFCCGIDAFWWRITKVTLVSVVALLQLQLNTLRSSPKHLYCAIQPKTTYRISTFEAYRWEQEKSQANRKVDAEAVDVWMYCQNGLRNA